MGGAPVFILPAPDAMKSGFPRFSTPSQLFLYIYLYFWLISFSWGVHLKKDPLVCTVSLP